METGRRTKRLLTTALAGLLVAGSGLVVIGTGGAAVASTVRPAVLGASPTTLDLGAPPLGTYNGPDTFTLTNNGSTTDTIGGSRGDVTYTGVGADDYQIDSAANCPGTVSTIVLAAGASCVIDVYFFPGALGPRPATLSIKGSADTTPTTVQLTGSGEIGYYQVDEFGDVAYAGDAPYFGDAGNLQLNQPIVAITPTGNNGGYWLVASDGGIFSYGNAAFYGAAGNIALNKPIVGMSRTGYSGGYWMVASDGGIFSYGDATFYGSAGNIHLNQPIVGMAATPDGKGYWLVASDGGVFAYGDATFYGSAGNIQLNQPIVSMAAMPDGGGYWFSAVDGGLFNYGTAPFYGSGVGLGLGPIVDMATNGGPTVQAENDMPAIRHVELTRVRGSSHPQIPHVADQGTNHSVRTP